MKKLLLAICLLFATSVYAADSNLSELTAATSAGATDLYYTAVGATTDRKITFDNLQLSITKVGTIGTGVWSGTALVDSAVSDTITVGASGSVNDAAIPAGVTRDTEWDTISEINTATTDADIIATNSSWTGGDLGGTGLAASVTDDSHAHTTTTISGLGTDDISGLDISADTNLAVSTPITLTGDSVGMVNQGTTTTVLHGDAAGNPAFSAVTYSDITAMSSDNLASLITNESGTGVLMYNSAPTVTGPIVVGATITGVVDAGGTTDFEIENGANPTVDTAGEISVDTSTASGSMVRFYTDAEYALPAYQSKSFVIASPAAGSDYSIWKLPYAITIKNVHALTYGEAATNVIGGLYEADANGSSPVAIDSDITATAGTNANDDGSLTNAALDNGDYINWQTTSVSGTVSGVTVTWEYVVNPVN